MQDLRLIGVHEDGAHLLLAGDDGERFRLPIDDDLRADVRHHRPAASPAAGDGGLRPRDVQALIRSGASAEEAAERAGWTVEKVHRYESAILAERAHIASLARRVSVRGRTPGGAASVQTVEERVAARLADRGVAADSASWDAWRRETGPWTVVAVFPAGGRERRASWLFDPVDRGLTALDDEARWLSGDEQEPLAGPLPAAPPRHRTRVYDVEAEGGLRPAKRDPGAGAGPDAAVPVSGTTGEDTDHAEEPHPPGTDEPVDLMTAMRERSGARGRRSGRRGKRAKREAAPPTSPAHVPGAEGSPDDALPLEDIAYDPETMPPPPAAHPREEAHGAHPPESAEDGHETDQPDAGRDRPTDRFAEPGLFDADLGGSDTEPSGSDTEASGPGTEASVPDTEASVPDTEADGPATPAATNQDEAPPPPRRASRKSGRPSVPSWDDIMFGAPRGQR